MLLWLWLLQRSTWGDVFVDDGDAIADQVPASILVASTMHFGLAV